MNCNDARDALLEAELPVQLNDLSPLAEHLRDCRACASVARNLEAQQLTARNVYQALRPTTDAGTAANAILRQHSSTATAPRVLVSSNRRHRFAKTFVVATCAAAAAALLITAIVNRRVTDRAMDVAADTAPPHPVQVQVPANQNAIVFGTRNPNITVVWIYSGD